MSEQQITLKKQRLPFTQVPNDLLCSNKITGIAKALWCVLYSKPDDWTFFWPEISRNFKEGREALASAKKNLEEAGYLKTIQKRILTGRGNETKFGGMDMELFHTPSLTLDLQPKGSSETTGFPSTGNQQSGIQITGNPQTDKDIYKQDLTKRDLGNKDLIISSSKLSKREQLEDESQLWFDEFWKKYKPTTDGQGNEGSVGSKSEARKHWDILMKSGEHPAHIIWGEQAYLKKISGRVQNCHAYKFLKDKRYEEFVEAEIAAQEKYQQESAQESQQQRPLLNDDPFWLKSLEELKNGIKSQSWAGKLNEFNYLGIENGVHIIEAPSKFYRDWFKREYKDNFDKVLGKWSLIVQTNN